ncbi:hypothetical protein ABZT47_28975, partial [Sphaerisporangium sp. NPDC005289]
MTATTQEQAFDPAAPRHVPDPHALFHRMREQAPFHRQVGPSSGRVFWYLTRYADVGRARPDPRGGRPRDPRPPTEERGGGVECEKNGVEIG